MQENQIEQEYIPGSCNIGPAEIKRRYRIGIAGLLLMALFIAFAEVVGIPQLFKLFLFAPTFYALSGLLQARQKFCYIYGWIGIFRIIGNQKRQKVKDQSSVEKDKALAISIVIRIFLGSIVITGLYYFLS